MIVEINGDDRLCVADRLCYLVRNLLRNLRMGRRPGFMRFSPWRPAPAILERIVKSGASPGRCLAEAFLVHELPRIVDPGPIDVLEIGCGSGRARQLLAAAGFTGRYTGIDVEDRFDRTEITEAFESRFRRLDAHAIESGARFDLILSNSALEHIPDDGLLLERLRAGLRAGGRQVHIVPAGAALFAYLWHGYRQYNRHALGQRFVAESTSVYLLGGAASLVVHLLWITLPEMILNLKLRTRWPHAYRACLHAAFKTDAYISFGAPMYAVAESFPEARACSEGP